MGVFAEDVGACDSDTVAKIGAGRPRTFAARNEEPNQKLALLAQNKCDIGQAQKRPSALGAEPKRVGRSPRFLRGQPKRCAEDERSESEGTFERSENSKDEPSGRTEPPLVEPTSHELCAAEVPRENFRLSLIAYLKCEPEYDIIHNNHF